MYTYIIKATTNNTTTRYKNTFKSRKEAQKTIDILQVGYYQIVKMCKSYKVSYPPKTIYEIIEIKR